MPATFVSLRADQPLPPHPPFVPHRIASLPPGLLSGCSSLWSLSLQGNPITADQLRSTPGEWESG